MACPLLFILTDVDEAVTGANDWRCAMNLRSIDVRKCDRPEKEVIEGLCLSYDMVRALCLETMGPCVALVDDEERK